MSRVTDLRVCLSRFTDLGVFADHEGHLEEAVAHEREEADDAHVNEEPERGQQLAGDGGVRPTDGAIYGLELEEEDEEAGYEEHREEADHREGDRCAERHRLDGGDRRVPRPAQRRHLVGRLGGRVVGSGRVVVVDGGDGPGREDEGGEETAEDLRGLEEGEEDAVEACEDALGTAAGGGGVAQGDGRHVGGVGRPEAGEADAGDGRRGQQGPRRRTQVGEDVEEEAGHRGQHRPLRPQPLHHRGGDDTAEAEAEVDDAERRESHAAVQTALQVSQREVRGEHRHEADAQHQQVAHVVGVRLVIRGGGGGPSGQNVDVAGLDEQVGHRLA